jgi:L-galactose dehydrogenase
MQYQTLGRTALRVSKLGFGAATLGNIYGDMTDNQATQVVHAAIDGGINFFDTSPHYGSTVSEKRLGAALNGRRQDVVLASKAGRYGHNTDTDFDFSASRIRRSVEESLRRLRTDYLDLFQLHDIEFGNKMQIIEEAMPTMHELKASGKVRYVGITGYPLGMLMDVAKATQPDTILSYCHYNLLNTTLAKDVIPFARANGVGLINASVVHMGLLTPQGSHNRHPAPIRVKEVARRAVEHCTQQGQSIVSVALQFALQQLDIGSTLVGMRTVEEVTHNISIVNQTPDYGLFKALQRIIDPVQDINWVTGRLENADAGSLLPKS